MQLHLWTRESGKNPCWIFASQIGKSTTFFIQQETGGQDNEELQSTLVQAPAEEDVSNDNDEDDDIVYVGRENPGREQEYLGRPIEIEPGILVL